MDLVLSEPIGAKRQVSRLSRELIAFARDAPGWKRTIAAVPILVPVMFGATVLIAGVAQPRHTKPLSPMQLEREEYAAPMVQLLQEMKKISPSVEPAGTQVYNFITGTIATPFFFQKAGDDRDRAATCLATAGWYEAGNDIAGQRAVMQVVLNRVRHPSFPKSVCGVVFQGSERTTGCQFSFTCDGSMTKRIPSPRSWAQARILAEGALNGAVDPVVGQATHFHADYVNPWWASKLEPITKVGAHIFYRWGGSQGALGSGKAMTGQEWQPPVTAATNKASAPTGTDKTKVTIDGASMVDLPAQPSLGGKVQALPSTGEANQSRSVATSTRMLVDSSGPSGRWAVSAMNRCADAGVCRVVAYDSANPQDDRPLFVFVRDASGMQLALWDCDKAPRSQHDQCLPQGAELNALIKGR